MQTFTAPEFANQFNHLFAAAVDGPVAIKREDAPDMVILSAEIYARLEAYENAYWIQKAEEGKASGYASADETEHFFKARLDA